MSFWVRKRAKKLFFFRNILQCDDNEHRVFSFTIEQKHDTRNMIENNSWSIMIKILILTAF